MNGGSRAMVSTIEGPQVTAAPDGTPNSWKVVRRKVKVKQKDDRSTTLATCAISGTSATTATTEH
jgi:hypothetical protein